ncbi:MAG: hypothetical protein LBQ88_23165 [Treponema sp.]|jgi:hypothetical protein|nr:hypothetical protein [Treponema sp.]
MALNATTLKNDLLNAFRSMTDGEDSVFAEGIATSTDDYTESGSIVTADAGPVSGGAFAGAGNGDNTTDNQICRGIVLAACNAMRTMTTGGNAYLAAQLAHAIHSMVMGGEVNTDVVGVVTPPPSASPFPRNGKAKGQQLGVSAPMQAAFLAAFTAMDGMTEGGDEYLAEQIATAVDAYLKAAVVNTNGQGALAGSKGIGAMT